MTAACTSRAPGRDLGRWKKSRRRRRCCRRHTPSRSSATLQPLQCGECGYRGSHRAKQMVKFLGEVRSFYTGQ
jgi:hypothetical protein